MIRRPSYASVTATLALFVGLSGSGYAAVNLSHASTGTAQSRSGAASEAGRLAAGAAATPLGFAHLEVVGGVQLDSALSYGVTAVVPAGVVGSQKKPIVCLYGHIAPHAVATATQLAPDNPSAEVLAEVDIAQPWMIQRCPQTTDGRVVAVVTIADIPKPKSAAHTTRKLAALRAVNPHVVGPPFAQSGVWIVFF